MKERYEQLSADNVILLKRKRNNNDKLRVMVIIAAIAIVVESIVLHFYSLKVKDLILEDLQKRNRKEEIKKEIVEMDNEYEKTLVKLETFGDYKIAQLKRVQALKDKLTIAKENTTNLINRLEESKANVIKSFITKQDMLKIENWSKCIFDKPCYRASEDSLSPKIFHEQCDGYKPTVTLIKSKMRGEVFGGFTRASWDGNNVKFDNSAFLFSLTLNSIFPIYVNMPAINTSPDYYPCFGTTDILLKPGSYTISSNIQSYNTYNKDISEIYFELLDLEVFKMKCVSDTPK